MPKYDRVPLRSWGILLSCPSAVVGAGGTARSPALEMKVQSLEFYLSGRCDLERRGGIDGLRDGEEDGNASDNLHQEWGTEYTGSGCRSTIPGCLDCGTWPRGDDGSQAVTHRPDLCEVNMRRTDFEAASPSEVLAPEAKEGTLMLPRGQPSVARKCKQGEMQKEKALTEDGAGMPPRRPALLEELCVEGHVRDRGDGSWEITFLATVATTYTPKLLLNGYEINLGAVATRVRP